MPTGDLPAVARRRVRLALRQARDAKGLTQAEVAEAMEWSTSKIMRIETGEVTVSPNDLRPLLAHLGIADSRRVEELIQDARTSRRSREWWDEPRFREHLTPALRQLIQYEVQATEARYYNSVLVPGRLQTRAYAEALLRALPPGDTRELRLEARLRRRKEMLGRRNPPDVYVLLDESVLYRRFGSAQVTAEQLRDLAQLANRGRVRLRVVPFDLEDAPPPLLAAYDILYLGSADDAVMYLEIQLDDRIVEDRAEIEFRREIFDGLWASSLDEATSLARVEERVRALAPAGGAEQSG